MFFEFVSGAENLSFMNKATCFVLSCRPTIVMFLDLKAAFELVDREAFFHCMLTPGVPTKYVKILKALYSHSTGRVRVYEQLNK